MNDAVLDAREHPDRYLPLDRRSAALFLADWKPLVRGVLLRMRVRELDAALSEVFRRALQGLPEFRGESRLSSWLYRIAWREGLVLGAGTMAGGWLGAHLQLKAGAGIVRWAVLVMVLVGGLTLLL